MKKIGITMGDPSGIGPEIIVKSAGNKEINPSELLVIGNYPVMEAAGKLVSDPRVQLHKITQLDQFSPAPGILNILDTGVPEEQDFLPGKVNTASGHAAFRYVREAVELAMKKEIDGIVTAPLNKEALHAAGYRFAGHTEILGTLSGTKDYAMMLISEKLRVIHVSTHISLLRAIQSLNRDRIETVIRIADSMMMRLLGKNPRIAVAGLNPHAGEHGLFGDEEVKTIIPAIRHMQEEGMRVEGPVPPDTVFLQALEGKYDVVVAMYHDQGHIPLKLIGFDTGVNVTAGLPFIRTSVDHGTAFDIAWKGIARETSMVEAIKLASAIA